MVRTVSVASALIMAACLTAAGEDPLPPLPVWTPDPLRVASLPFDVAGNVRPHAGEWAVTVSAGWFNLWSAHGHAGAIRREFGLPRDVQITDEELRQLELRYPEDDLVHADLEGVIVQTAITLGLSEGVALSLRVPWVSTGRPSWDAIPEEWHDLFGLTQSNRQWFPRGGSLIYIEGTGPPLIRRDLDGSGIGDVALSLSATIGRWLGAEHSVTGALELPTGRIGTIRGSGGVDVGGRWSAEWRSRRDRFVVTAGFTYLDRDGSLLGVVRDNTWHVGTVYGRRLGDRWAGSLEATYESSPLAGFTSSDAGEPSVSWTAALSVEAGERTWWSVEYGANSAGNGLVPDLSLSVAVSTRFRGRW